MMTFIFISTAVIILVLVWLTLEYSFLIPPKTGLPVLMYHKVSANVTNRLSVSPGNFMKQMEYIRKKGYKTMSFAELAKIRETGGILPSHPIVLTFDDAFADFTEWALPTLKKFNFKATVFIPVAYIGKSNLWDKGSDQIMSADQIKAVAEDENIEFGMHSFLHRSYGDLNLEDMQDDLENCYQTLTFYGIRFVHVLAYPFGGYPKKDKLLKSQMKQMFREKGLEFAMRIGNRINSWPLKNPYEMKRIDIKGTDNFTTFKTKIRKGRKKLFS